VDGQKVGTHRPNRSRPYRTLGACPTPGAASPLRSRHGLGGEQMNRPIDLILPRLNGLVASADGKSWQASCPAHGDNNPSLSVSVRDDGRVLLHCHARCDTESVVKSL